MNSTLSAPSRDPHYRFLKEGEFIEEEDEFWDAFERKWVPVSDYSVGVLMDKDSEGHFRRLN